MYTSSVCVKLLLTNYLPLYLSISQIGIVDQKDGVLHVYIVSLYISTLYLVAMQRKWHFFIVSVVSLVFF